MQWPRILAQAIVDPGKFAVEDIEHQAFIVTVWGELHGGDKLPTRKYEIAALNEDIAARTGLDRYVCEQEKPN